MKSIKTFHSPDHCFITITDAYQISSSQESQPFSVISWAVRTKGEQVRAGIPDLQNALRSSWWDEGSVAFLWVPAFGLSPLPRLGAVACGCFSRLMWYLVCPIQKGSSFLWTPGHLLLVWVGTNWGCFPAWEPSFCRKPLVFIWGMGRWHLGYGKKTLKGLLCCAVW